MAFPQVQSSASSSNVVLGESHTVTLPANIAAGDLLIAFFSSGPSVTIAFPGGWTKLFDTSDAVSNRAVCYYRVADGEEGASITVTTSANARSSHMTYRISSYSEVPENGVSVVSLDYTPDPPNLSPTWGAKDTLWVAFFSAWASSSANLVSVPANYGNEITVDTNTSSCPLTSSARRELNAESENPGVFTMNNDIVWIANVVAIRPAAAAGWPSIAKIKPYEVSPVDVAKLYPYNVTPLDIVKKSGVAV